MRKESRPAGQRRQATETAQQFWVVCDGFSEGAAFAMMMALCSGILIGR
jgi:hypothetical protein